MPSVRMERLSRPGTNFGPAVVCPFPYFVEFLLTVTAVRPLLPVRIRSDPDEFSGVTWSTRPGSSESPRRWCTGGPVRIQPDGPGVHPCQSWRLLLGEIPHVTSCPRDARHVGHPHAGLPAAGAALLSSITLAPSRWCSPLSCVPRWLPDGRFAPGASAHRCRCGVSTDQYRDQSDHAVAHVDGALSACADGGSSIVALPPIGRGRAGPGCSCSASPCCASSRSRRRH